MANRSQQLRTGLGILLVVIIAGAVILLAVSMHT